MCSPASATNLPLADTSCACCSTDSASTTGAEEARGNVSATATEFQVTGMTCGHCVSSVTKEVSQIPGVTAVTIDLVAGGTSTVSVTSDSALDRDAVASAIDEAGYELAPSA